MHHIYQKDKHALDPVDIFFSQQSVKKPNSTTICNAKISAAAKTSGY